MVYLTRTRDLHLAAIMTAHLSWTLIVAILRGSSSRWIAVSDQRSTCALAARRRHSLCFTGSLPWTQSAAFQASDNERKQQIYFQREEEKNTHKKKAKQNKNKQTKSEQTNKTKVNHYVKIPRFTLWAWFTIERFE